MHRRFRASLFFPFARFALFPLLFAPMTNLPFVIFSSPFATPINGQGRAAPWTPMISRLSRRDADIEIACWCNCVKRRGKREERSSELGLNYRSYSIYYLWNINGKRDSFYFVRWNDRLGSYSFVTSSFIFPTLQFL